MNFFKKPMNKGFLCAVGAATATWYFYGVEPALILLLTWFSIKLS